MKQELANSSWLQVDDPQAARLVVDVQARRFLEPFVAQESTVGAVAAELGVHPSSVLYRVRQFIRLGLIKVLRLETRKGRAIKHYRTVADNLFVPFEATALDIQEALSPYAFGSLQQLLNQSIGQAWLDAAGERPMLGFHLSRNDSGRVSQHIVPDPYAYQPQQFFKSLLEPDAPAVWDSWGSLRLARDDAKALQQELARVIGRYQDKAVPAGGDAYIVRLAVAPLRP